MTCYHVDASPKMLKETLAVAQFAMQQLDASREDGYNAGASMDTHLRHIQQLIDECSRKRPTGSDGKHGNLHTLECGDSCQLRRVTCGEMHPMYDVYHGPGLQHVIRADGSQVYTEDPDYPKMPAFEL